MLAEQLPQTNSDPNSQPPKPEFDYDLTIVGGGIVGATLACALKNSGLKVAIVESQLPAVTAARRQAYALTLLSGMILEGLGVWEEILPQITTFPQINLCDGHDPGRVEFTRPDLGDPSQLAIPEKALGYVGEHGVLLTALQRSLEECPNFSWVCPAEVVQVEYKRDRVEIQVQVAEGQNSQTTRTQILRTRLVVAADGARSQIRQSAGITTHGWKYWQSCIAMTIKTEKPHHNIAYERFWPSGPMGVLPLPENRFQIVWTAPHAEAKALQALEAKEFLALLDRRLGHAFGQLEFVSDRYLFPVQLMQSDRYALSRLVLVGDAAHCCHPVGGQGLNMGIRDAAAIAQILKAAHQNGEDIGDLKVLKRYESWRQTENLVILGFTDFLDRLFSNTWLPIVAFRRFALGCLRAIPWARFLALRVMTGLFGCPPELAQRV